MSYFLSVIAAVAAVVHAGPENGQQQHNVVAEARQLSYGPQYPPVDLQLDFTLLDPQLQYPPFSAESPRLQPQVLLYPGGAPGQPFLLQPGAPPGNFLIPQPHPGVILRDAPPRPPVFVQGYPKPAHIPPINKDAEEIPTSPGAIPPIQPTGRKPEKLETFDIPERPEHPIRPIAGEADVLASADRTFAKNPPLKPGHRFFILNGQPLFSNYPLPNFANSPFQPAPERFAHTDSDYLIYRQNGPSFLPDGFNKVQFNDLPPYKVPINGLFVRNSVTGQISSARPNVDLLQNDIGAQYPQNLVTLNQPGDYKQSVFLRHSLPIPLQKQGGEPIRFLLKDRPNETEKLEPREKENDYKLRPIQVPDEDTVPLYEGNVKPGILDYFRYRPNKITNDYNDKEAVVIEAKSEDDDDSPAETLSEDIAASGKSEEPSISQAQPGAIALAGPGGVAAAAPRGTALTGDKGLAVSSPQATAIAGPSRDQIEEKPEKSKKGKP